MYIQTFQNILHNVLFFPLRASRAAGPQSSYHQSLLYPPHLETHSVLSRVSAGVEGGGRLDMKAKLKKINSYDFFPTLPALVLYCIISQL